MDVVRPPGRRTTTGALTLCFLTVAALLGACGEDPVSPGSPVTSSPEASPSAPSPTPEPSFPVTLTDDDDVQVTLEAEPERIVTWAPSNTEIVYALGLGDRVVGVSGPFDDYPPAATEIEHVGGSTGVEPNIEKVVSLEPDVVLNGFLGGDDWKARLRDVGIPVFSVYAADFDDALRDIETVGRLFGAEDAAADVVEGMAGASAEIEDRVGAEPRVTCFFEVGYPDIYTVGPQDFPFDMLERAGCDPVTADADTPYPVWSLEQLLQDDPAVYILTSEAGVSPQEVGQRPGFGGLSAIQAGRVYLVDSDLITRPGPRLIEGLEALAMALHPTAFA